MAFHWNFRIVREPSIEEDYGFKSPYVFKLCEVYYAENGDLISYRQAELIGRTPGELLQEIDSAAESAKLEILNMEDFQETLFKENRLDCIYMEE